MILRLILDHHTINIRHMWYDMVINALVLEVVKVVHIVFLVGKQ